MDYVLLAMSNMGDSMHAGVTTYYDNSNM